MLLVALAAIPGSAAAHPVHVRLGLGGHYWFRERGLFDLTVAIDANQPLKSLLKEPRIIARYQELVDKANQGMDHWSTIKRFSLIPEHLTIENGLLTPTLKVKRNIVNENVKDAIEAMY